MIPCVSLVTVYCLHQTETRDFYVDVLGFERGTDITMGEGFRWVTIKHPSQPELEITLMTPGAAAGFRRRRFRPPATGEGRHGRAGPVGRRLPQDLRGALREGRDVPAGAVRPAVRRGSGDARQHRQLAVLVEPREFAPEDFK